MALAEGQVGKVREGQLVFQAAWHAPAQLVDGEGQPFQVGEAAQLRRYPPKPLSARVSRLTPPSSLVKTAYHSPRGASLSQLSLFFQFSSSVAL